jgi:acyl-homoserine-lactone acylase
MRHHRAWQLNFQRISNYPMLTHSQSVRPDSDHYADQTKLYADKRWVRFPFCEEDIVAQQIGETLLLEE